MKKLVDSKLATQGGEIDVVARHWLSYKELWGEKPQEEKSVQAQKMVPVKKPWKKPKEREKIKNDHSTGVQKGGGKHHFEQQSGTGGKRRQEARVIAKTGRPKKRGKGSGKKKRTYGPYGGRRGLCPQRVGVHPFRQTMKKRQKTA